jgi:mono/diheme cytochrome c family protein
MTTRRDLWVALGVAATVGTLVFAVARVAQEDEVRLARERAAATAASFGSSATGRALFARMACGSCHRLAAVGSQGGIGPDLDERLRDHTAKSLKATIVNPPSRSGFVQMPGDFGERMTDRELDALVGFLLSARRSD